MQIMLSCKELSSRTHKGLLQLNSETKKNPHDLREEGVKGFEIILDQKTMYELQINT